MRSTSTMIRMSTFVLCAFLLVAFGTSEMRMVQGNEPPQPVASSRSAVRAVSPEETPDMMYEAPSGLDSYVHLPVAFRPALLSPVAQQVVDLTNQERTRVGCPPLSVNPKLVQAAQGHTEDMAVNDFFSHTGSNGSAPWDRMEAAGYEWREAGENIAAGYTTPQAVMNGWMNSDGHRANILRCSYEEIGVGYIFLQNDPGSVNYRYYWTQVFGRPR